jgi:periplasmic copper chaperone A
MSPKSSFPIMPMRMFRVATLFFLCLPLLTSAELLIEDPWTPEAPPGRLMAGFMTLTNTGDSAINLVAAESPQFDRVEIHTMVMEEGVMRMRRLDQLVIEAGEMIELKPGGHHLMMMQPLKHFARDDQLNITLIDESGRTWPLVSTIRPRQPAAK